MATVHAPTEADTFALGKRLGRLARAGTVVTLIGDLGAGKTVFARGVGAGLDVQSRVRSPTFILVQTHTGGRLPLWHADLYRLDDPEDLIQLGLGELLDSEGVVIVEWGDRFPEVFGADHLQIRIDDAAVGRQITVVGTGPRSAELERQLAP